MVDLDLGMLRAFNGPVNLIRKELRWPLLLSLSLSACTDSVLNNKDFMPATGREGLSPNSGPMIYPSNGGVGPNQGPGSASNHAPTSLEIEVDPILDDEDPKALTDVKVLKILFPTADFKAFDLADAPPVLTLSFSLSNIVRSETVLQTTGEITEALLSVKIGETLFEESYKSEGKAVLSKKGAKDAFYVKMVSTGGSSKSRSSSFYIRATRKHVGDDNASQQLQDLYRWRGEVLSTNNVYMGRTEGFITGK